MGGIDLKTEEMVLCISHVTTILTQGAYDTSKIDIIIINKIIK